MSPTPANLSGVTIGALQVTEPAEIVGSRGACWWMVCTLCKAQWWERATTIRRRLREGTRRTCRECGA